MVFSMEWAGIFSSHNNAKPKTHSWKLFDNSDYYYLLIKLINFDSFNNIRMCPYHIFIIIYISY